MIIPAVLLSLTSSAGAGEPDRARMDLKAKADLLPAQRALITGDVEGPPLPPIRWPRPMEEMSGGEIWLFLRDQPPEVKMTLRRRMMAEQWKVYLRKKEEHLKEIEAARARQEEEDERGVTRWHGTRLIFKAGGPQPPPAAMAALSLTLNGPEFKPPAERMRAFGRYLNRVDIFHAGWSATVQDVQPAPGGGFVIRLSIMPSLYAPPRKDKDGKLRGRPGGFSVNERLTEIYRVRG